MTLRSQGNNGLVDTNVDISTVERSLRRARNQAAPTEPIRAEMEQGQVCGEGNTTHLSPDHHPDVIAEGVDDFEVPLPRHRTPPPPRNNAYRRRHVEVDEDYDEEDEKMIGSWNEPGVRTVRTGIPTPDIHNPNFKINNGLLNAVQNSRFNRLPSENPLDHIDMFERACSMYKVNGVSMDTTRMMFFPFSLDALARKWERPTPSRLLSNWDDVKKEFLSAFFSRHRTERIREDIAGFRQGNVEPFSKAWTRFQDLIQDCPHHGYGKGALLGMFYRGCKPRNRELMDSSTGGNYADNTVHQGWGIISKIARNGDSYELYHKREISPRKTEFESVQFLHDKDNQDNKFEINYVGNQQNCFNDQAEQRIGPYDAEDSDHESDELRVEINELKGMMKAFIVTQEASKARMCQWIKELEARFNRRIDEISDSFTILMSRAKLVREKLNFSLASIELNEDKCLYLIDDEKTGEPVGEEGAPSLDEHLSADSPINRTESDADHGMDLKAELQTREFETAS